jgi:hypothetical protein
MPITVCAMDTFFVVIANDAILTIQNPAAASVPMGVMGGAAVGAIGGLIAGIVEGRKDAARLAAPGLEPFPALSSMTEVRDGIIKQLPAAIKADPAFPKLNEGTQITLIPKRAIMSARLSIWNGLHLSLRSPKGPQPRSIGLALWHMRKVRKHLESARYPLGS